MKASAAAEATKKVALDAGLSAGLSIDLAAIEGKLRAHASATTGAMFRAPVDIIVDNGTVSFVAAASMSLDEQLSFGVQGEVGAKILTVPWRKTWDLVNWRSGSTRDMGTDLDLVYINGIQGDKSTVVSYDRLTHVVGQLKDLGGQMMNLTGPGAPAPSAPPRPNRNQPLELAWPKPPAERYPNLYITARGETRTQAQLREEQRQGRPHIVVYTPMRLRQLPHGGAPIGLGDAYNQAAGNDLKNAQAVDTNVNPQQRIPMSVLKDLVRASPGTAVYFFRLTSFGGADFR